MDSAEEARDWIANWETAWGQETGASWAIVRADRVLGQIGLRRITLPQASAELSYWLLPEARGAGVAGRAVRALTRWAFTDRGFHRLTLRHSTGNLASCRVAAKTGFVLEGTSRGSHLHADGWHDVHLHSLLCTDDEA